MSIQIITGDCIESMRGLPEKSVQCVITSPPYFGLRNYGAGEKEIGLEGTPEQYVAKMVEVFAAAKRVLRDDGTLWLNLGDSYAGSGRGPSKSFSGRGNEVGNADPNRNTSGRPRIGAVHGDSGHTSGVPAPEGFKVKDLMMIPARVAIALQADGWYLRAACPWIKRNGMPDSTIDRPTQCIETMFMLTKSKKTYYDAEAVKKAAKTVSVARISQPNYENQIGSERANAGAKTNGNMKAVGGDKRLRRTSDWFFESWQGLLLDGDDEPSAFVVNLKGYKEAHFATFPPKLIEPCVLASTSVDGCCSTCKAPRLRQCIKTPMVIDRSERTHDLVRMRSSGTMVSPATSETTGWQASCDCNAPTEPCTILDPFGGSGTTAEAATQHGRNTILCELNAAYVELAHKRLGTQSDCETMEFG